MRPRDFVDYFRLRRLVRDAGAVRRWGMHSAPGEDREVVFHDGRRLWLRGGYRDYHIFDRIFLQDTYRLANLPARLGCVLDVGANIGLFACCVAPQAERVVCFEPSPGNFALLERNTAGLAHVAARQEAMAGEGGEALLHVPVDGHNTGAFSLFESDEARADAADVTVPTVTLEAVLDREGIERCGLVKMDIEGAEYAVLYATPGPVLRRVDALCGEYHRIPDGPADANMGDLAAFLRGHGFTVATEESRRKPGQGRFFARR